MVFHADYEEALEQYDSPNSTLRVGDLVRPVWGWFTGLGIVSDIYDVVHDQTGESYLQVCKVFMAGKEWAAPVKDFKLVERE